MKFDQRSTLAALMKAADRSEGAVRDRFLTAADLLESGKQVGPRTYELDIKADPKQMLDWDTPLREQGSHVVNSFSDAAMPGRKNDPILRELLGEGAIPSEYLGLFDKSSGAQAYKTLAADTRGGAPMFSQQLSEAGIPGIKYLDEGSRTAVASLASAKGRNAVLGGLDDEVAWWQQKPLTSNYVVFDPSKIDIRKKYGIAAGPGAGAAAAASGEEQN